MKKCYYIIIFIIGNIHAQIPAKQNNKIGFRSEWFGGLNLHSLGWGATLTKAKFKTYKKTNLYTLDIVTMKHPKEFKVVNQALENAKGYKFGKTNSLANIRFGIGRRIMIFEKFRKNGLEIYFNTTIGGNVGFLKPIYLEILNYDVNGNVLGIKEEQYDPAIHNQLNIYGKSSAFKGFSQSKYIFGGHLKTGFTFEFSKKRDKILALETGLVVDVYPNRVPMMAFIKDKIVFVNFYINILFGKKYYN